MPVNDAPTVAVAAGGACGTNDRSGTINVAVNDLDGQQQTASLKLSALSNNTRLVPTANVTFGGSGASRTLTATAVSGKTGTATITVTVSDGAATGTTALTLKAVGNSKDTLITSPAERMRIPSPVARATTGSPAGQAPIALVAARAPIGSPTSTPPRATRRTQPSPSGRSE